MECIWLIAARSRTAARDRKTTQPKGYAISTEAGGAHDRHYRLRAHRNALLRRLAVQRNRRLIISTLIYEDVASVCPTLMLDETRSGSFAARIRAFEPKHPLIWLKGIWHPELESVSLTRQPRAASFAGNTCRRQAARSPNGFSGQPGPDPRPVPGRRRKPRYANVRLARWSSTSIRVSKPNSPPPPSNCPTATSAESRPTKARWLFPSAAPMIRSSDGRKISIWLSSIRCRRNVQPAPIWIWWRDCGRVRLFWSAIPREAIWRFTRP